MNKKIIIAALVMFVIAVFYAVFTQNPANFIQTNNPKQAQIPASTKVNALEINAEALGVLQDAAKVEQYDQTHWDF